MPHFWIDEAGTQSIYDLLGPDYTLLSFGPQELTRLIAAFHDAGVPLKVINAERPDRPEFKHRLLIVRHDQHVAWRGDSPPEQPQALVARLRGALPSPSPGRQPALASAS